MKVGVLTIIDPFGAPIWSICFDREYDFGNFRIIIKHTKLKKITMCSVQLQH
jgi:hypothetical protein